MGQGDSPVQAFYRDKVVFITGGTGFIGKVLLEKLLRNTGAATIYLLIRPKKGVSPAARLKSLLDSKLFDTLKTQGHDPTPRVKAMLGDIHNPGLGLSKDDTNILFNQVEIVLHCAATVRFDENLSGALSMNVRAVASLLDMAKQMKRLLSMVHVSTAYANCNRDHIEEDVYPGPVSPKRALGLLETLSPDVLDSPEVTSKILALGNRPNTYTFTKAIAEELVETEGESLPVCIVRPSIVVSSWKEPVAGWVDNLNGPTGLFLIAGIGVMRTARITEEYLVDGVPVDTCANLIIVAAMETHRTFKEGNTEIQVYNHISGNSVPLTWGEIYNKAKVGLMRYPLEGLVWYPGGSFKTNHFINRCHEIVLHEMPAHITDLIVRLCGKKPFAVRLCNKMTRGMRSLEYFTSNQWTWTSDASDKLNKSLDAKDREMFFFRMEGLDWDILIKDYVLGTRKFVLKQSPSSLPACRRKLLFLCILHNSIKAAFWMLFLVLLYRYLF